MLGVEETWRERGKLGLTTGKEMLPPELRRESGVASRGGVALNNLPARPKGGGTKSPGKDLSRRGGACLEGRGMQME